MPVLDAVLSVPDYGFDITDEAGHSIRLDIPVEQGGGGSGFRPMQTLLAGLCGCSGVDVVSILKKQKQPLEGLSIHVEAEREQGREPALWETIRIRFNCKGQLDPGKVRRAVSLSLDKYCSVAETLRRAGASISWKILVNGTEIESTEMDQNNL